MVQGPAAICVWSLWMFRVSDVVAELALTWECMAVRWPPFQFISFYIARFRGGKLWCGCRGDGRLRSSNYWSSLRSSEFWWRCCFRRPGGTGSGAADGCTNNLKQLALAAHNPHDTFQTLPSRMTGTGFLWGGVAAPAMNQVRLSAWVLLLPFFEQQALHNQIFSPLTIGTTTFAAGGTAPTRHGNGGTILHPGCSRCRGCRADPTVCRGRKSHRLRPQQLSPERG